MRAMLEAWGIDTSEWKFSKFYESKPGNGQLKLPEIPQEPDIAHQVPCQNCKHTLASHELKDMFFEESKIDDDHTRLSWEWSCLGLACSCRAFQPASGVVKGFKQKPPI